MSRPMLSSEDSRKLDRREFTNRTLMALLAGVSVSVVGCSSDSPMSPTPAPPQGGGSVSGNVTVNHGHTASISAAQLTSNNDVTIDIRGQADHPHSVTISISELAALASGQRVTKESSVDSTGSAGTHSHTVIFN